MGIARRARVAGTTLAVTSRLAAPPAGTLLAGTLPAPASVGVIVAGCRGIPRGIRRRPGRVVWWWPAGLHPADRGA